MVESLHKLAIVDVLGASERNMLVTWLINSKNGPNRIRASVPSQWIVGSKTGTGSLYGTTNDIAILWPPNNHAPILIGVFYTSIQRINHERRYCRNSI